MIDIRLREANTEILEILKNIDENFIEMLPQKFITFLEENKSDEYKPNFDYSKELKDWDIREETKNLLGIMYLNYWSTPDEKSEYVKILNQNEEKYENELKEKYNPDNLFKNKRINNIESFEENVTNEVALVKYNESLFRKIWNKILSMFKKK